MIDRRIIYALEYLLLFIIGIVEEEFTVLQSAIVAGILMIVIQIAVRIMVNIYYSGNWRGEDD